MQYPLPEKIGVPELLVGREKEFANFDQWVKGIPRRISKSRVILARRKSGKTAFVQRLFNQMDAEGTEKGTPARPSGQRHSAQAAHIGGCRFAGTRHRRY